MGIHDRDYYRTQQPGMNLRGPRTMIGWIILINVVVFVADGILTPIDDLTLPDTPTISGMLSCKPYTLVRPWLWWQFLTYGFTHAPMPHYEHILFNMLSLFFLGPPIEQRYGSREFLRFYLVAIVLCGVVGSAAGMAQGLWNTPHLVGASGAVVGVVLLFIVNYPRQTLLLFFVLPVPAWLVGVLLVVMNLFGQAGYGDQNVAYGVHLVGLAFAGAYYHFGWNLTRLAGSLSFDWLKRRPKFRVHDPGRDKQREDKLSQEVDRILEKIHQRGEASLTKKERHTLETASREYQKNRHDDS